MATLPMTKQAREDMRKPNGILSTSEMLKLSISRKAPITMIITPAIIALRLIISREDSNQVVNKLPEPNLNNEKNSSDVPLIIQNLRRTV